MKRHVALRGLSSEHHAGLVQARRILKAAASGERLEPTIRRFLAFGGSDLAAHMREEEDLLFPEFARVVGADNALVSRAVIDHLAIRTGIRSLELDVLAGSSDAALLGGVGKLLEAHIRFEERELFPAIERALSVERLAAVGVLVGSGLPH